MKINILTLFPEMFTPLQISMLGKAQEKELLKVDTIDIRGYTKDKHNRVDDYIFGGGVGMLMQAEPIFNALEDINAKKGSLIYMSPKGRILDKEKLKELSDKEEITILCGHYEGIDERVIEYWDIDEISIGDYILTGGEPAAIVLVDALARFLPEVLGDDKSVEDESIYSDLLEFPQYTRPRVFRDMKVPEILLSGHHKKISLWQYEKSLVLTKERRPDLFEKYISNEELINRLSKEEREILERIKHI